MITQFKLQVKGKQREFKTGLGFLGQYQKDNLVSFNEITFGIDNNPLYYIPDLMYHSMSYAAKIKDENIEFTKNEFLDWIDETGSEAITKMGDFKEKLIESLESFLPKEKNDKTAKKKDELNWNRDVISFSLGELGVSSLNEVNNMSWAEFELRLFAYNRMQKNDWYKLRFLAYENLKATQYVMNSKAKIPKTIDAFMRIGEKENTVNKKAVEALKKAREEYNKLKSGKTRS